MTTLKGWREFCDLRRQGVTLCNNKTDTNLNRFHARSKAAKQFRTVVIDGYSDGTRRRYSAGQRGLSCAPHFSEFVWTVTGYGKQHATFY